MKQVEEIRCALQGTLIAVKDVKALFQSSKDKHYIFNGYLRH